MDREKLRAEIKRELNRPTSMKKLAELLNRCFVALGEQQSVADSLRTKLIEGLDEITSLSRNLRHGGCDSTDLLGLEEGLTHAIDVASEMLSLLAAPSPVQSVLKVKCGTCWDSGIVGHSDICPECAGSWKPASAPVQGARKLVLVELHAAQERIAELEAAITSCLPCSYYMDLPDGGSNSLEEQLRRMAKDAADQRAAEHRLKEVASHCATVEQELAALKAQEPVAEVDMTVPSAEIQWTNHGAEMCLPHGTKLYAAPANKENGNDLPIEH